MQSISVDRKYKANHLLRVSAVTRVFQKDVDEQLIMSGHRSIDEVRAYKHILDNQKQQLSEHLQAKACNKENIPDVGNELVTSVKPSQHPVPNIQGCSSVVINYW